LGLRRVRLKQSTITNDGTKLNGGTMIQIALVVVSIGLVVIGIKGFTRDGLTLTRTTRLSGASGKIVGTLCILLGLGLIPLVLVLSGLYGAWLDR